MDDTSMRTLMELGQSVLAESELEPVLQRVLAAARDLTGAQYAAIGVLDERRNRLERFITSGIDDETRRQLGDPPEGHGVLGELIREPQPLRLPDVGAHPRSYGFPIGHPPMTTFLGVPVLVRGEAWGNLYLTDKAGGALFDDDDELAIGMLAEWAAIAIVNARRLEDVRERRDELERTVGAMRATVEISRALAGETDLDVVLELIAKRGRALVRANVLVIQLATGDTVRVAAVAGDVDRGVLGREIAMTDTVAGRVLATRRSQRLSDEVNRNRFEESGLGRVGLQAAAGLFVPLVFRNEAPGVLVALNAPGGGEFSADDERLLTSFATSAASAVMTARLVTTEQLRAREAATEDERRRWARELHDETLQGLGALRVVLSAARRSDDPQTWRAALEDAVSELDIEIGNVRGIIADVRPASLDQLGASAALEALADRMRSRGVDVELAVDLDYEAGRAGSRHEGELETAIYRIAQEGMTNAVKHSGAAKIAVQVAEHDGQLRVRIHDDGRGFDPGASSPGFGLVGIRERVESLGGRLAIDSAPGAGATITAHLPASRRAQAGGEPADAA